MSVRVGRRIRSSIALSWALALAGAACVNDGTAPGISLVGAWDFIGFTDAGVAAVTTGTWTFAIDSSVTVNGTVTFPGEPTDSLVVAGTYSQNGNTVQLIIGTGSGDWTITSNGDQIVLTEIEPPPANTVTLRRR
jgi:hypothetical protein